MNTPIFLGLGAWLSQWVVMYYVMQQDYRQRSNLSFLCLLLLMATIYIGAICLVLSWVFLK